VADLPSVIGLAGYAGSGKSTLAALLAEQHGYTVRAFADPLRELCRRVSPIVGYWPDPKYGMKEITWASLEGAVGYQAAKEHSRYGAQFRGTMQRLGTEARAILGEDVWVDAAFTGIRHGERIVFADVRFPNEVLSIARDVGGQVVRIARPGVGPVNGHISETAIDHLPLDLTIVNDGPPEQMLTRLSGARMESAL
jgi:hypothetical protein